MSTVVPPVGRTPIAPRPSGGGLRQTWPLGRRDGVVLVAWFAVLTLVWTGIGLLLTGPDSGLVRWDERLGTGRTVWEELVHRYNAGVDTVRAMQRTWGALRGKVDERRFRDVESFLAIQEKEARWWRDAALTYFRTHSRMPIPARYEQPAHDLDYYRRVRCPADRDKPRCDAVP